MLVWLLLSKIVKNHGLKYICDLLESQLRLSEPFAATFKSKLLNAFLLSSFSSCIEFRADCSVKVLSSS